ncbi:HEAT repeat domain-containing protein [Cronobacter dublinensis]
MNPEQKSLVLSVVNNKPLRAGKITDDEFLELFPCTQGNVEDFVNEILKNAHFSKDPKEVEYAIYIGFHFGFTCKHEDILIHLLDDHFHYKHDDVVLALVKIKAKSDNAVNALYNCALSEYDYLVDDREDDNYTLAWNCIYALAKIGSHYAIEKLKELSHNAIPQIKIKAIQVGKSYGLID